MRKGLLHFLLMCLGPVSFLHAQAFQNLNFESANVTDLSVGHQEFVAASDGLPGWSAYIGTNQLTEVGHNVITLGAANVGIWGPDYGFGLLPLQGSYSAILQPGAFNNQGVSASIAQTGLVPASAKSIQFLASLAFTNDLVVTIGGQNAPIIPLGSGSFGCDISVFAGSIEQLEFSIVYNSDHGNDLNLLDAITFSTQAVPEPSISSLVMMSIAGLGLWRFTSRKTAY